MKILYLHGIGSGADSRTQRELRNLFPNIEIIAPELPSRPKEAVAFIKENYAFDDDIELVIGTSLGGFYALTLTMVKKVLINPAMFADEDILKALGYGNHDFLCERSDGKQEYCIDEEYINELSQIRRKVYEKDVLRPDRIEHNLINETYALFGMNDAVVAHYDDFCKIFLKEHAFLFPGEHRLTPEEIRDVLAPLIKNVLDVPSLPFCYVMSELD